MACSLLGAGCARARRVACTGRRVMLHLARICEGLRVARIGNGFRKHGRRLHG